MKRSGLYSSLVLGICLQACVTQALAQGQSLPATFDQLLAPKFKPDEPGCVALVASEGRIIYKKAFGMADLGRRVPMNTETVFQLGSITKQITAVAVMQLVEQGKISLQDPIGKFIKDYPTHGHTITIENLLTHTSGIADYAEMANYNATIYAKDFAPQEFIDFFKNEKAAFAPGEEFRYCNSGYFLLGYVIEKVSGMSYGHYIETNIFTPAGMSNSYYASNAKNPGNLAKGYSPGTNGYRDANYISVTQYYAAGGLMATAGDLFKYYRALGSYKLIGKDSLERTRTSFKLPGGKSTNYGYGVGLGDLIGTSAVGHAGGVDGFYTNQIYFPKEDVLVVVFTNCDDYMNRDPAVEMAALALKKRNATGRAP